MCKIELVKYFSSQKGSIIIPLLILLLTAGAFAMTGGINGFKGFKPSANPTPIQGQPVFTPEPTRTNLQAQTFTFSTPTPPPQTYTQCSPMNQNYFGGAGICCVDHGMPAPGVPCCDPEFTHGDGVCDAKPVIYLYPKIKMTIGVKVDIPGKIIESIPRYPVNGWQNIIASPDGTFVYENKTYKELFYETFQNNPKPPLTGIVVESGQIGSTLKDITTRLGLVKNEQNEFLSFWIPKLEKLNKPYVLISVFIGSEKNVVDHVEINPTPDTFINFIMYYKGLDKTFTIDPIKLPAEPPKRVGFTAVEWGGIIDQN